MKSPPEPKPIFTAHTQGQALFEKQQDVLFQDVSTSYRQFLADKDAMEKAAEEAAAPKKKSGGGGKKKKKKKKK